MTQAAIARTDEQGQSYTEFPAVPVRNASRIPIGTFQPIRDAEIWRNVANNLGRADMRQLATDFLRHGSSIRRGALTALPAASVQAETREQDGRKAPFFRQTQYLHQAQRLGWLHQALERMQQTLAHVREIAWERLRVTAWERSTPERDRQRQQVHQPRQGLSLGL